MKMSFFKKNLDHLLVGIAYQNYTQDLGLRRVPLTEESVLPNCYLGAVACAHIGAHLSSELNKRLLKDRDSDGTRWLNWASTKMLAHLEVSEDIRSFMCSLRPMV